MNLVSVFIFLFILSAISTIALAQEAMGNNGDPGQQKIRVIFKDISNIQDPGQDSSTQSRDYFLFIPYYQNENLSLGASAKNQKTHFNQVSNATNFKPVDDLQTIQYGLSYTGFDSDKNIWSLNASYGSASDQPFKDSTVSAIDATLSKKVKESEEHSWMYFLNYSNNRTFLSGIPLPGIAYTYTDLDKRKGWMIGIPFWLYWARPDDKWTYSTFIFLPSNITAQAGYFIWQPIQVSLKFQWNQQSFFRHGRTDNKEQIYFEKKRLSSGLKLFLGKASFLEIEVAKAFDQALFDGESMFNKTSDTQSLSEELQSFINLQYEF
jgi:hypothetical protein